MRSLVFVLGVLRGGGGDSPCGLAQGLQRGGTPQADRVTPVNAAATPHRYQISRDSPAALAEPTAVITDPQLIARISVFDKTGRP